MSANGILVATGQPTIEPSFEDPRSSWKFVVRYNSPFHSATTANKVTLSENVTTVVMMKVGVVKYEDRPVPELSDPHAVLVRVCFTGICGSDVHYYTHGGIGKYVVKQPMVLGHESAGVVHAVGSAVKSLVPGDRVAMEPGAPCRHCTRCLEGRYNLCPDMVFAATPPVDGTLAKFYVMPEDFCYKLPPHVSMEEGALLEPAAVAVHFCRLAQVAPGHRVVVFGAGPVGLLACKVARGVYGATTVVAVDVNQERLAFAEKHGATHVYQSTPGLTPQEMAQEIIAQCALGDGADVVIDASGAEPCIQAAVYVARNGGVFMQGGMGKVRDLEELWNDGGGGLSVKELISKIVPFEQAKEAFDNVKIGNGIKWLIEGPKN
ncbi:unnamed protein product [Phytophthora fragariaefolia]|uniref:Unnamed protein product n=1 Tax=Phytophthora fragariaefolia TaxID=1490495 RepID=A0A9W7CW63_9STRA|nr:unnamed protein product [Phytophthora fragariaefolia]